MKRALEPWPSWTLPVIGLGAVQAGEALPLHGSAWLVVVLVLLGLARPRGWWLVAWIPVLLSAMALMLPTRAIPSHDLMTVSLDRQCRRMEEVSQRLAQATRVRGLLAGAGEALDPTALFRRLDAAVEGLDATTVYLVDDRGDLVAWGGANHRFPTTVRPLGPRRFAVDWSATSVGLVVREPVFIEGRLMGAVVVLERRDLTFERGFGLPAGARYTAGWGIPGASVLTPKTAAGLEMPVSAAPMERNGRFTVPVWTPWALLVLVSLILDRRLAAVPAAGGLVLSGLNGPWPVLVVAGLVVVLAWSLALILRETVSRHARTGVVVSSIAVVGSVVLLAPDAPWLPRHLFEPGVGAAWVAALGMLAGALPTSRRRRGEAGPISMRIDADAREGGAFSLEHRLARATVVAGTAVVLAMVQLPLRTARVTVPEDAPPTQTPVMSLESDLMLPAPWDACRTDDLATALARQWFPDQSGGGRQVVVLNADGETVSRWGDLGVVGDRIDDVGTWPLARGDDWRVHVLRAAGPWAVLPNWPVERGLDSVRERPVWWAVFARSGAVEATLHRGISNLSPEAAGRLLYEGGGWLFVAVDGHLNLARAVVRDGWLLVAIARSPTLATWVARGLFGVLWALLGLAMIRPPAIHLDRLGTFGGRLRLLVAGGVVVPLTVLALLLQIRFSRQEEATETALGSETFEAARYTTEHLADGVPVDDDLAVWLARGWGGEAVIFDGPVAVAGSRPDLVVAGRLPELPSEEAFLAFSLGRESPLVVREGGELVAAGAIGLDSRRLLLHLYREVPWGEMDAPVAADWLLGGAVVAALVTLVFTARIESRLSASLRDLVGLSRDLLDGRPLRARPAPAEQDIAQVLAAVQTMADEVRSRENRLREQEEMLRITLATLGPAVLVLGPDGAVRFSNPSADALLHDEASVMGDILGRARSGGPLDPSVRPHPGREVHWRVTSAQVPLAGGEGTVVVVDDVTGVVRADRLEQLNQLARIVAHEVKNPLTPIRLWVQELDAAERAGAPEHLTRLIDDACREIGLQTDRLQYTANAFSNLVALEHWEPSAVDLGALADQALRDLATPPGSGIELVNQTEDHPCVVEADPVWLRRAVDTVLSNSLRALGDGGGVITIRTAAGADGRCRLWIEDTGGGVDDAVLGELFNPRFSTTSTGTGLGLALVRRVVRRCAGTVEAANGRLGLVVTMDFPVAHGPSAEVG
jgi:signal transduction histidine kinase